jgi:hypothetical protein
VRVAGDHFAVYHSSSEGNKDLRRERRSWKRASCGLLELETKRRPLMNIKHKFALTLLTGLAIGLAAGTAIHAQQVKMAPGYFVAGLEITDAAKFQTFVAFRHN